MPSEVTRCQFCGNDGPHPAAHIWPQALYLGDAGVPFKLFNAGGHERPRRSQIGIYDDHLWCSTCERKSNALDSRAAQALLNVESRLVVVRDASGRPLELPKGEPLAWTLTDCDPTGLHFFIISVLWRASASSLRELAAFRLGPYQERFRELLTGQNIDDLHNFPYLMRLEKDVDMRGGFVTPVRTKYDGVNFVQFHGGGFAFYVKVSNQPIPETFRPIANGPDGPVTLMGYRLLETNEGRSLADGARRSAARVGRR